MQNQPPVKPITYRDAGVDIDKGDALVGDIKPHAKRTMRAGADTDIGGFGGLFDLKAAGFTDPILVAATDGVGTKLELAQQVGIHRGLGIDLVAMCANDILAQGAMPMFFLDYFATGKLETETATQVIAGVADGCVEAGCALIGGETAEMPGVYPAGGYDLAGFCVGAAERGTLLDKTMPQAGDAIIALASAGIHANGFSLVRRVIARESADLLAAAPYDENVKLGESLLTPTRIYTKAIRIALETGALHGMAHITGGGLIENPPRCFGAGLTAELDMNSYQLPPVFQWLKAASAVDGHELARTFNCGVGALLYVRADAAAGMLEQLQAAGETAWQIGSLKHSSAEAEPVQLVDIEAAWRA